MNRQRAFLSLFMLAAVTMFSACGVSGDEPGDDVGGGAPRRDGSTGGTAPHTPGTACSYDQNTFWSCGSLDPCAPLQQFCQANRTWSECVTGPATADCRQDAGRTDAGPSDGGTMSDGASDADSESDSEPDACMCPPSGHACYDACGNAGTAWCPPETPCDLDCWFEPGTVCEDDAGVPSDGGFSFDGDVPPVLDGDACVCPAPEICRTECGIEGFRLCDRSIACGLSRCLVLPGSTCSEAGPATDAGPTDAGPMDSGVCSCPPPDFCPAACGFAELVCNPTDCSTSCVPIPGTCFDSGPADAGPADAGPMDAGPADAGAGTCACPTFGNFCSNACGAAGFITCSAAPACTEQCFIPPGSTCADAGPSDSGPVDSGPTDAGPMDAGPTDSGPVDSGPADTGPVDSGPTDAGPMSDAGPAGSGSLTVTVSIPALDAAFGVCTTGGWQVVIWDWFGIERESAPGVATLTVSTPPLSGYRGVTVKCGSSYKAWPIAALTLPANSNGWITSILLDGVELADDEARVCHDVYSDPSGTDARFNRPMVPMTSSIFRTCP